MRHYEGVFREVNAVVYYSNTGQSAEVADYLANALHFPAFSMENASERYYETLVLVFPVHCQNVPQAVADFLKQTQSKYLCAVATYGKMWYGNVLYEIQNTYRQNVIAAAYVPAKHTYLEDNTSLELSLLQPLIEKVKQPAPLQIPRSYKNPIASLFPVLRGRLGVKLIKSKACNGCGLCTASCTISAMRAGKPNRKCIRCLKCVQICPKKALSFKVRLPLRLYLRKKPVSETVIYV